MFSEREIDFLIGASMRYLKCEYNLSHCVAVFPEGSCFVADVPSKYDYRVVKDIATSKSLTSDKYNILYIYMS